MEEDIEIIEETSKGVLLHDTVKDVFGVLEYATNAISWFDSTCKFSNTAKDSEQNARFALKYLK